ncbi:MAG: 4-hydroxy-tetrahydrodipicolinate reductase [Muribaculaceae bacterium]|nr:4-hydroxy-tetrahydrodipicolinate reductase [Muribaculaceae bacterium]
MKIAIIGHGKMGHMIEDIAKDRGHEIVAIIDEHNREDFASAAFASADVAIEFTRPDAAVDNLLHAFAAKVPVVCGTTGWLDAMPQIETMCVKGEGTLLWSSNFSIGMNIFMALNRYLADIMVNFPQYRPSIEEVHHIHKLDHPSGTAITLAEQLIRHAPCVQTWQEPEEDTRVPDGVLPVKAVREGEVPGIHSVTWDSEADSITITHSAKSRRGFAMGAVLAAEWLAGKKGFHTMSEMLSDFTKTTGLFGE